MTTAIDKIRLAKAAASSLAQAPTAKKNEALNQISLLLNARADEIIAANNIDIANGQAESMTESLQDRLRLNHDRIAAIADAVLKIISLPDPIGDVIRGMSLPNALKLTQVRVPLGLIGVIYEARPNDTIDIAAVSYTHHRAHETLVSIW
jgi:glutamate-5-semialdehyde dehydrogenase